MTTSSHPLLAALSNQMLVVFLIMHFLKLFLNLGFKTRKIPSQHEEMDNLKKDLMNIVRNIKFQVNTDEFQRKLKKDIKNPGEELWPKIYMLSSKCAIDTGTKVFQYKILNNVLYLNKHLYKMKVVESPLCSLFQKENETICRLHFFEKTMDR